MGKIACYCRVSTEDQSLERQLTSTHEYSEQEFGADLGDLEIFRDKSTGTNTDRSGYQEMMDAAGRGDLDAVVVHSVSRICRSISDLERTAARLEDAGVELHIVSEGLTMRPGDEDPFQRALFQLLGVFAELEANMAQMRTKEGIAAREANPEYHHGPAPLGFKKNEGYLIEAENYHSVVTVLNQVDRHGMSKRQAARLLDTSRATIDRCLDRLSLYGLENIEEAIESGAICYCCGLKESEHDGALDSHHTSYREPEVIPVCRGCHKIIHDSSDQYADLQPELTREEAEELGYLNPLA